MPRQPVCRNVDVAVGTLKPAMAGRTPIVLSRLPSGEIRAFGARCPHQGAALQHGCITGLPTSGAPNELRVERECEVVRCPWHGFEWDLVTGFPIVAEPSTGAMRLRFFEVSIEGDQVVVVT